MTATSTPEGSGRTGGVSPLLGSRKQGADAPRSPTAADVPDPPKSPKGRLRYWNDIVQEAVAELRRQLRSHDPDRADRALFAAIDRREARLRAAYIEATGRTPEEDFPLEAIGYFSGRPCVVPDHLKHLVPGFRQPKANPEPSG